MVGVNFATSFLRQDGRHDVDTPMELVFDHVEYILKRVGDDGVGFGSDFDGARIPAAIGNASRLQSLVEVMRTRGYGKRLIEKLCYKNDPANLVEREEGPDAIDLAPGISAGRIAYNPTEFH
jgi:membrane dipeptidase